MLLQFRGSVQWPCYISCICIMGIYLPLYYLWVGLWTPFIHTLCVSAQSCPTLCDYMDCSLPGPFVHGIFQARILEWVAISHSRRPSWPRDWTRVSGISCVGRRVFLPLAPPGKPHITLWLLPLPHSLLGAKFDRPFTSTQHIFWTEKKKHSSWVNKFIMPKRV